jgi:acetyl esterase/lipase
LAGASAGGGIAAGTALKARDLGAPQLAGQLLLYPMLDDRNDTTSSRQVDGRGIWDRNSNALGWAALLNGRRGNESISGYAAPASAESLDNLPPTYLDCGSAEVFRDEITAYASRIWSHGGSAELHVWSGGFHAFDLLVPEARVSRAMVAARMDWLRRLG